jgi:opacity protein-like surface antigen
MKRNQSLGGLVIASALLLPAQIFAQFPPQYPPANVPPGFYPPSNLAPGFYAGTDIRAVIPENTHVRQFGSSTTSRTVEFDPGAEIMIRGGYRFCEWFALEGEVGGSGNSIHSITGASSVDANIYQVPFMANAILTLPTRTPLTPFIGAGVGGVSTVLDSHDITIGLTTVFGNDSTTTFAYQAFGGLQYAVNEWFSIGLIYNYRHVDGPKWDRDFPVEFGSLKTHSAGLSFNFRF